MTLINRANDGHFNILVVIYQNLLKKNPIKVSELIELCSPKTLVEIQKFENKEKEKYQSSFEHLHNTLKTWTELGLIVDKDGKLPQIKGLKEEFLRTSDIDLCLSEEDKLDFKYNNLSMILKNIPKILNKVIFLPENNKNFWSSENNKSSDFTRALSWMLSQNIYEIKTTYKDIKEMESYQITNIDYRLFQNDTRWAGFSDWALSLGWAWSSNRGLQLDPTEAIKLVLPEVFNNKKELSIDDFINILSDILPVIDHGKYRLEVEKVLNKQYWKEPNEKELSLSLSLALKNLELQNYISFSKKSDTSSAYSIMKNQDKVWEPITHISYIGE